MVAVADTLDGGDGNDSLYSADYAGNFNIPYYNNPYTPPLLDTGSEVDTLIGGAGDDRLFAGYGDNVDGGANGYAGDYLYISFQGAPTGVTADFRQATQVIGGGTITGIENVSWVQGSNYDDTDLYRQQQPVFRFHGRVRHGRQRHDRCRLLYGHDRWR